MCFFPVSMCNSFFFNVGTILEAKNRLKIDNFRKKLGWKASSETLLLENCLLMAFEAPGMRFRLILEPPELEFWTPASHRNTSDAFQVEGLTLMIRATRGRSMDEWMDGWTVCTAYVSDPKYLRR